MPNVQHVVVLMLENASFDRLLGFCTGAPRPPGFAGLRLPFADGYTGYVTDPDPTHELTDVTLQVFGGAPVTLGGANNAGFVASYRKLAPAHGDRVMGCFDPSQLQAITALANEFVVLDRWYSSVPGPTWPNRFFAHCASSGGLSVSPSSAECVEAEIAHTFPMPTVFEALERAGRTWNVYFHDVPQALALSRLHGRLGRFKLFEAFLKDAAAGTLPSYAFLEPAYFNLLACHANDMHPPHDVRFGDKLVADTYNALRAGPKWGETALLVLWDEHGGFYDRVPPPDRASAEVACPPDDASKNTKGFQFDRLGVRVPAILASPWAPRAAAVSDLFEHSAIPATLRKLFGLGAPLTRRDAVSKTFDVALSLDAPRPTPATIPFTAPLGAPAQTRLADASSAQRHLLALASALPVPGAPAEPSPSIAGAVERVASYVFRSC